MIVSADMHHLAAGVLRPVQAPLRPHLQPSNRRDGPPQRSPESPDQRKSRVLKRKYDDGLPPDSGTGPLRQPSETAKHGETNP